MQNTISPGSIVAAPPPARVPQARPRVNAKNPDLRALTSITWAAVKKVNAPPEFFSRESSIIHIPASSTADKISCQPVGVDRLKWWLTQRIDFFQDKNGIQIPARPPLDLLRNMLATPDPPLPHLIGIVRHPLFGSDGALQTEPGYSPATQRYYVPDRGLVVPAISGYPTQQEIDQAKANILEELLGDFPFVDDPSRAHTVAALLLPFVRPMITGPTPLHLIWKPKAGTGATLLAETLCLPSCGSPSLITVSKDEDERRRTILAILSFRGPRR